MTMYREGEDADRLIDPGQPYSRVDRNSKFNGRYEAMQNLLVEGTCSGEIDCRGMLVIAEGATVEATIIARDVRIAGVVKGEIDCTGRFELLPSGRASGSVKARQIVIHEGAEYDGDLQMTMEPPRTEPAPPMWESATVPPLGVAATSEPAPSPATEAGAPLPGEEASGEADPPPRVREEDLPEFLRPRHE
ncbi:MAG: polymer-forming cytoskeletal protein [Dehalococcoidia bacterium]|nr:polymer-forming cytoskeletal protein [Dehalococcoidia bacterium]